MRKKILSGILSLSLVFANIAFPVFNSNDAAKEVNAATTDKWSLVWSDEFDGTSLNRNNWNVEVNGYGGWNNELQYYCDSPENIQVSNGTLKLIAQKKQYQGKEYTSARLNTQNKVTVHHGRIEARMKLPCFKGAFPAFWMMGANGKQWPACGEIDIMEIVNDESIVYGTAHWQASYANNEEKYDSNGSSTRDAGVKVDITQWHTYGIEWTDNKITWFVDDNYYHSVDITSAKEMEELAIPSYILLNFAIGGDWPGFNIDNSALPATVEVDYVRAYEVNDNYVEPPTIVVEEDIVANHTGRWTTNVGTWGNGSGTMTSSQIPSQGFNANLTAIGTDMWAIYARLDDLKYTAGSNYTFKCTLTSNINKNVFIKVEGDNQAALAEGYVALKANQPYNYETTVFIPNTYTGGLSLYYAVGGVMNGETLSSNTAANISVKDVSFSAKTTILDPGYTEDPTTEAPTEKPTEAPTEKPTEAPTVATGFTQGVINDWVTSGNWGLYYGDWSGTAEVLYNPISDKEYQLYFNKVNKGAEWLIQARYDAPAISGHTYKVTVDVTADKAGSVGIKEDLSNSAQDQVYTDIQAGKTVQLSGVYTVTTDAIRVMFELGKGIDAGTTLKLSNIKIEDITVDETSKVEQTTVATDNNGPLEVIGEQFSSNSNNTINVVWGQDEARIDNGQKYNVYVDNVLKLQEVICNAYAIENISAGVHTVKITAVLNGKETAGVSSQVEVKGSGEVVTDAPTEKPTEAPTEEPTTTVTISSKLNIYGYQVSTTAEGFRTIYTIDDSDNQIVSSGLVYGLYDIPESDLVVGSTNSTVYNYESTNQGKINFELKDATGTAYAMTMKFIKNVDFFNSKYNVRAYAKLKDGSYIYSEVVTCTIYNLADYLYQNQLMNTIDNHNYLYNNILSYVNRDYKKVEYDLSNILFK